MRSSIGCNLHKRDEILNLLSQVPGHPWDKPWSLSSSLYCLTSSFQLTFKSKAMTFAPCPPPARVHLFPTLKKNLRQVLLSMIINLQKKKNTLKQYSTKDTRLKSEYLGSSPTPNSYVSWSWSLSCPDPPILEAENNTPSVQIKWSELCLRLHIFFFLLHFLNEELKSQASLEKMHRHITELKLGILILNSLFFL